jgi:UDP-galactopyranose mutase
MNSSNQSSIHPAASTELLNVNYYQTHVQVNYPNLDEKFTRITEYKHSLNQKSKHTIISKEYSCDIGEPYYPILNDKNIPYV